jgi:hypothetical protein
VLKLDTYITIGDYEFDNSVVELEIINDIDSLTDTCKITIPKKLQWNGRNIALGEERILKRGDKVLVQAGYDGVLNTEFIGYVRNIKTGNPVVIECEDGMFLLKKGAKSITYRSRVKLADVLNFFIPKEVKFICADVLLGDYRFNKVTPAQVLEDIKKRYGLYGYFRLITQGSITTSVLYVGLPFWTDFRKTATFMFGQNYNGNGGLIINSDDLVYRIAEDVRLKVKAININRNNTRNEIEVGDEDGDLRTAHYYNVDSATLKQKALQDLERFKYTGYYGSFLTFGEPSVQKGDLVKLIGNEYNPDGTYLTKKITKRINTSIGYQQLIEPSSIVNDQRNNTTTST